MLERFIAFSLSRRLLVLILTAALVAAGVLALSRLPIDAYPDVSTTQVQIVMKAPGMTPEEVEAQITTPIERELLGIPRETVLRSVSKYAVASITVVFEDGTDVYWARQQVAERFGSVSKDLPDTVSGGLAPITTPLGEMFMFTIEGPMSPMDKRTLLDWTIRPQLRTLPGVADVNSLGGLARAYEVAPDPARLAARGVSLEELRQALLANNRNDGAGRIAAGEESILVRSSGRLQDEDDVRRVVVGLRGGVPVRVGDVAQVRIGALTRYGTVTRNGEGEAVEGLVLGLRGANARTVVEGVQAKLDEIAATLPKEVRIVTFYDRGALVSRAVHTVSKALYEAIALVAVLLVAFLGNLRAALVVSVILPLSALLTFILMRLYGLSANLMSLGGLAIAIGMLVDAAVVVVENVESHFAHRGSPGVPALHVIYRAAAEVALPVAAGVAIIIIVFLPLLTLQGLEGKLFIPVALTIVFALGGSLLLSLTVIPMLSALLLKPGAAHDPWLARKALALYRPLLEWALDHARTVTVAALLLLGAALAAYPLIGKSFMPSMDEGTVVMQMETLPSISLPATVELDLRVQQAILAEVPDVDHIVARSGSDELGLDPMGLNETDTFIELKPRAQWQAADKEAIVGQIRRVAARFPGVEVSFTQPIEMRVSEMLSGVRGDLAVKIFGADVATLNGLAAQIVQVLGRLPGAQDVLTKKNSGVEYLQVALDREAVGRMGLDVNGVENDLRTLIEGQNAGVVMEQDRRVPLLLRGPDALRLSPALLDQLRLPHAGGEAIPLSSVARLQPVAGPVRIERENAQRLIVAQANVAGRDLVGFVREAQAAVAQQVRLPEGYRLSWGGQFENQQRAAQRLMIVVPVALALIFLLLYGTFGSLRQALLVLLNIPFAMVGGVFSLLLTGEYLSVPASVGFIALMGIAVLNGLVLVSYFNQLLAEGLPLETVVREGGRRRLRPVLMTACITAFGLVPLLFSSGPGSEVQKPLAVVVIGGLLTSTALTLLLLPLLFRRFGAAHQGNRA